MRSKFISAVVADMKNIFSNRFLIVLVVLFILIIFLSFYFPVISNSIFLQTGFRLDEYYSLISITIVAIISVLIGIEYGKLLCLICRPGFNLISNTSLETKENLLFQRVLSAPTLSFILIILSILFIKPVPTQGWLRTLYAAIMLSIQTVPACFIFIKTNEQKRERFALPWFLWIILIAMPVGLLLHHPWNYFTFFSPYYWIAWSWMIRSPMESFFYGLIALVLTSVYLTISLRHFPWKKYI